MSSRRKSELAEDLGARIHAIKQKDPELTLADIAQRLGYSGNRIRQVYGKWKKKLDKDLSN